MIKGIGQKIANMLDDYGIHSYEALANLKSAEIKKLSKYLGSFGDRITRDNWVGQAKELVK